MKQRRVVFQKPGLVELEERPAPCPAPDQVLVQTTLSAISPGTEMLVYRGEWPRGVPVDDTIAGLRESFSYPLAYGYGTVGRVTATGKAVATEWLGRRVFAFHPHEDLFRAAPTSLHPIPDDLDDETALFLPTMETAITLLMDGRPLIGEKVAVFGQGVVGLLTTALLSRFPLASLLTVDSHSLRRQAAMRMGASECLDPADPALRARLGMEEGRGGEADLAYELSGNPAGLNLAVSAVRFSGRVVIGSWYGAKRVDLDLGSFFHRGRIALSSSQVSTIPPDLSGRWSGQRRLALAWEMLRLVRPAWCITHRFPLAEAAAAYQHIDCSPEETIQVILEHGSREAR